MWGGGYELATAYSFVDFKVDYYSVTDPSDVYGPFGQKSRQCLERMVMLSRRDLGVKGEVVVKIGFN